MTTLRQGSRGSEVVQLQTRLSLIADGIFGPLTEEAVKDFQKQSGLVPDGIVGPATHAALWGTRLCIRNIDEIILHCTATPEGRHVSLEEVRDWHVRGNGWSDIGYHYLILLDGTICDGRPLDKSGAHCIGHNSRSIGIAYVGGCAADGTTPKDTRTPEQRAALKKLVAALQQRFPAATVHCHNEFAAKACPYCQITEY